MTMTMTYYRCPACESEWFADPANPNMWVVVEDGCPYCQEDASEIETRDPNPGEVDVDMSIGSDAPAGDLEPQLARLEELTTKLEGLVLPAASLEDLAWYRDQHKILRDRIHHLAKELGVLPSELSYEGALEKIRRLKKEASA